MNCEFDVVTFSPMNTPINLRVGIDPHSQRYKSLQTKLSEFISVSGYDNRPRVAPKKEQQIQPEDEGNLHQYESIEVDVQEMHICTVPICYKKAELKYVFYPNGVAVVEAYFLVSEIEQSEAPLEKRINRFCAEAINSTQNTVFSLLNEFVKKQKGRNDITFVEHYEQTQIFWTSRALCFDEAHLSIPGIPELIDKWLENTEVPGHAQSILDGLKTSMTWLNYVLIDVKENDYRIESMTLAQYCYFANEKCNLALRTAIDNVYQGVQLNDARRCLQSTRAIAKLHQISVNEQMKYLTRPKRNFIKDIFASWEYDFHVENGKSMIEICNDKIAEVDAKQRNINSKKSDRILFSISLFAVFELLVFLSQYSREVMSRPALDYTDSEQSWILAFIAGLDADFVFGIGIFSMFSLGVAYFYAAKEKL